MNLLLSKLRTLAASQPWQPWATLAARIILGGVLLVAGALKIGQLDASIQAVRLYQILPFEWTTLVGIALPIIEIVVGLLLITGTFTRISAVVGGLLMVAFIIGIASVWARGISIDCGCFGGAAEIDASKTQYPWEILRDTGLLACAVLAAWRPAAPWSVDRWLFKPIELEESAELAVEEGM